MCPVRRCWDEGTDACTLHVSQNAFPTEYSYYDSVQAVDIEADEDRLRKILLDVVAQDNANGNAGLRLVISPSLNDLTAEDDALNTDGTLAKC